jgi:hypothetical protein
LHRHHHALFAKLFSQSPFRFIKRPVFYSNAKTGSPEYFVFAAIGLQTARLNQIKYLFILVGAVERANPTRTIAPEIKSVQPNLPL